MSCGCSAKPVDQRPTLRARGIVCQLCIYAEHAPGERLLPAAVACTVSGRPVGEHITAGDCPKGKHPDAQGMVRWGWVMWYGVPRFLRWILASQLTGPVPGCGCNRRLKDLWLRLTRRSIEGGS